MKHKSTPKKVIIITGDLASGKTTFSKYLSNIFKLPVFHKDTMKEVLGDTIGFSNRDDNIKLSIATIDMICYIYSQFGQIENSIILEGNFHTIDLDKFNKVSIDHNYQTLTIII